MSTSRVFTPPPDLEIVVRMSSAEGRTSLTYILHSPGGVVPFTHREIPGPKFMGNPDEYHRQLLHQIENLGHGLDAGGVPALSREVETKLAGIGRRLWRDLFNDEMRQAYRLFRDESSTLLIVSDEPWIPWEMVKPYDDQGEIIDDEFFAERFEITRWLARERVPLGEIKIKTLVCVAESGNLPQAREEREVLARLARSRPGLQDASPGSSKLASLLSLLAEGGIGLLHLTGHGTFDPSQPNEAGFRLADGSVFRPSDLHGLVQTQIGKDRPLVFLNACHSSRQGWSLTSLGGWAYSWVRVCGCGSFIGPQWPVRDSAAFAFAQAFYSALQRGHTCGQAAKAARLAAREATPGNPSWLAYAVYGQPNARALFGDEARPEAAVEAGTLRETPVSPLPPPSTDSPKSSGPSPRPALASNRRLKRRFTDLDRDRFIEESFVEIGRFFENSLATLKEQEAFIETAYRPIDRHHFHAAIYVHGTRESCHVWVQGGRWSNIAYSSGDDWSEKSYNESLSVVDNGYSLLLQSLGLRFFDGSERKALTPQEAAEYLWSMLIGHLQ